MIYLNVKQYSIKTNTIKNIIQHIKKCKYCVVNQDFYQFIYERTGNNEAKILKNKRERQVEEENESIEKVEQSSDRVMRSHTH